VTTGLAPARARRPLPPRDALLTRLRELLAPEPAAYALGRSLQHAVTIDGAAR
jgi:hypothetical protein